VDGDDFNDPIPDAARGILDGHINLSRDLAAKGHFPAIEVTTSASRVMRDIISKEHWNLAIAFRSLLAIYQQNLEVIQIGAYQSGANPILDRAIAVMPQIEQFLKQEVDHLSTMDEAISGMLKVHQASLAMGASLKQKQ
jgi:flagellum-specific ATP synthase